jgi:hypothetical protein
MTGGALMSLNDNHKWVGVGRVAVILPSRGLIFSRTAEELLNNLKGIPHKIYFSHRKPIPDCFEYPTREALRDPEVTHVWFVEDDMVLPPGTLKKLLDANANAVTFDYPVTKAGNGSVFYDQGGTVVFCGTGCLLVKRRVLESLKQPYFTDKVRWSMLNYGEAVKLTGVYGAPGYGTHDVTFGIKLWNAGVMIKVIRGKLAQRKLVALGKSGSNNGQHTIEVWKKVVNNKRLKELQKQPVALGANTKLVTVDTPTGGVTTSRKHAETLVNQGLATYPIQRFTIIDDSEVEI